MAIRYGYADVPYGQVHYARFDDPSAPPGTPVVLINSRSRSFLPFMTRFPGIKTVLNVDVPGFGVSTAVPSSPTMRDIAGGVRDALDALGIPRARFAAIHTGHKVATALAASCPDHVDRLAVIGRSHSLIPDHARRNAAMQAVVEENQVDMAIIRMEGRYADDTTGQRGFLEVFQANYTFDFTTALRSVACPVLVAEITSDREDMLYGRQAAALTAGMADVRCVDLPMTDPTGLMSYAGVDTLAAAITPFLTG